MSSTLTAKDAGAAIRAARHAHWMTQAQLARKAGVGRQWLVAVEQGHERAEFAKMAAIMAALGMMFTTAPAPAAGPERRTWLTSRDAAEGIRDDLEQGDTDFALRTLARALADLRTLDDPDDIALFLTEPPSTGDHRWDVLIAAAVGRACRILGFGSPAWTRTAPLASWWFPVFDPILTARILQRTPVDFASRGIWLDSRALEVM